MCTLTDLRYYEPPEDIVYVYEVDENGIPTNVDTTIEGWDDWWRDLPSYYKCACGYGCQSWDDVLAHLGLDEDGSRWPA